MLSEKKTCDKSFKDATSPGRRLEDPAGDDVAKRLKFDSNRHSPSAGVDRST
jgi:hypothetical protein